MSVSESQDQKAHVVIRKLGGTEKYQSALHFHGYYFGTIVACRYALPSALAGPGEQGKLMDLLEHAAAQVVMRHPVMRVGLAGESTRAPTFIGIDYVDLGRHIEWSVVEASDDLDMLRREALRVQADTRFTDLETRPGWRLVVLRRKWELSLEVILAFNHPNMDGTSGKLFHDHLLRCLNGNDISSKGAAEAADSGGCEYGSKRVVVALENHILSMPVRPEGFPPPHEKLSAWPLGVGFTLEAMWKAERPELLTPKSEMQLRATWAPIRLSPYRTQFCSFDIEDGTLRGVLGRCREHGTTLTGLLHSLTLVSLAMQLPRRGDDGAAAFTAITAVNTRRYWAQSRAAARTRATGRAENGTAASVGLEPHATMGDMATAIDHEFRAETVDLIRAAAAAAAATKTSNGPGDGKPPALVGALGDAAWRVATQTRDEMRRKLETNGLDDIVGLTRFVADWRDYTRSLTRKPRRESWVVTNIGVLEGSCGGRVDEDGAGAAWRIRRAEFLVPADVPASAMHVSAVSVRGRGLTVNLSWQDGVVAAAVGEGLLAHMEGWLRDLGR